MGNNKNKKPEVEAPVVEAPASQETTTEQPATVQAPKTPGVPSAMSQNAKVEFMRGIQHRKDEMLNRGGESADKYTALTMLEDATILDIALTEAFVRRNPIGVIMVANEQNWNMFQALGEGMGVKIPDYKTLPKPTKEQLKAAGLEAAPGQVVLAIEDKHVSAETKKKVKNAAKINEEAASGKKEYLNNHTLIETDDQLKESLEFQLVNSKVISPLDRLVTTAQFYRAYLEARAEKSDNPETELAKIHEFTLSDLLQDVSTMVSPSFTAEGFGRLLCKTVATAKSPIPAFEMLKRCCKNRKTGEFRFSDEDIAALVRVLVVWKASAQIASLGNDIKALSKDAKKNAAAIEKANKEIAEEQALMSMVNNPSYDLADSFIAAYNDKENEMHNSAIAVYKAISETYYKNVEVPELEFETMLLNVQQHAGIDLNLFNESMLKRDEYSIENIVRLSTEPEPQKEGESKNSLCSLRKTLHPFWAESEITSLRSNKMLQL